MPRPARREGSPWPGQRMHKAELDKGTHSGTHSSTLPKQKKKLVQKLSDGQCCSGKQEKVFPVSGCASKTDDHTTV